MNRIEKFLATATQNPDFEAALITSEASKYYLVGTSTPEAGTLVVTRDGAYFIVDSRYIELAQNNITSAQVILQGRLYDQVEEILALHNVKNVWIEDSMTVGTLNSLKQRLTANIVMDSPLTAIIAKQRAVKDQQEAEFIRVAQQITEAGFDYICTQLAPGKKESDMALELENYMKRNGATGLSFPTILISGAKTSMPHGTPGEKIIEKGDFVTMDYAASYMGYCSDMTRTVAIGSVTPEMEKVYNIVLKAQTESIKAIKAGVIGKDIDKVARDIIYGAGYEGCFGHSLGHSYGLEIHEKPMFSPSEEGVIEEGVMITVEPGIYLPGKFGVRIEDTVRVTKDGCINLTSSPKQLIIL